MTHEEPTPLIEARNLAFRFPIKRRWPLQARRYARAVDGISFTIATGETLGLVGESGCGKSTTGKLILALLDAAEGEIRLEGRPLAGRSAAEWRALRRNMQMIFQNPIDALNPRLPVGDQIREVMREHRTVLADQREGALAELVRSVGLHPDLLTRYPHQLSGGQLQRIVIARALSLSPKLLVCDEAVAALDVSVRAQIVNLLADLRVKHGLSYLFISHDLSVVRHICDRVAVMYLGRIVETAPAETLFERPAHPYTRALISAVPVPDPAVRRQRILLEGEPPSVLSPPGGCTFHTRCAHAIDLCRREAPKAQPMVSGQTVACHRAKELA